MRIVIDLQGAQTESRYRGIGRYSLALAQGIVRHQGEHEVVLALNGLFPESIRPLRQAFSGLLPPGNIRVWYAPGPVRAIDPANQWRRSAAEQLRQAFVTRLQPDILLVTSLFEGYGDDAVTGMYDAESSFPTVAVLYDLIPHLYPETYLAPNPNFARFYENKIALLEKLQGYLAISRSSAREGITALGLPEEAVTVISTACDDVFRPLSLGAKEAQTFLATLGINKKFILYSGGADQRKNLFRFLSAYALLPKGIRKEYQLVFAGRIPPGNLLELRQHARSRGLKEGEFLCTGYVSEEDLVKLYNLCSLFVLPSLHEGFGLPALEAMSCGAPVIGSNVASIPEVIGLDEAIFNPLDEQHMAAKITQALRDEHLRARLRENAETRKGLFSWDATAKKALAFLEILHRKNGSPRHNPAITPEALASQIGHIRGPEPDERDLQQTAWALCINSPEPGPARLFVDVSELSQRDAGSGVQRVTKSILKELLENPPPGFTVHPVFATVEEPGYRYAVNFTETFQGDPTQKTEDPPVDFRAGDLFVGLDLQHHVVQIQKEYLGELHRAGVIIAFVVYDLLPVLLPHCFLPGTREGHEEWLHIVSAFDGAFCISRSVARELEQWQRENLPQKTSPFTTGWFHLGADIENGIPSGGMPKGAEETLEALSSDPTLLMVGTLEPRKGYAHVLEALEILWNRGQKINLVIVGRQGWSTESLAMRIRHHRQQGKRLFWFQGSSDEFLERLYRIASALLAASEGEGFGLPLIEAARHNLPLILRDIPVFREVAGEYGFYFVASRGEQLAQALEEWLALYHKKAHPLSGSMPWLTWKQSARQLTEGLLKLHRNATKSTLEELKE